MSQSSLHQTDGSIVSSNWKHTNTVFFEDDRSILHSSTTSACFRFSNVNMAPTAAVVYFLAFAFAVSNVDSSTRYASAIVESCGGCQLNRHAAIKQFINEDVPQYADVEFKHIQGAVPELVLFDENNAEVKRLHLAGLTREECNDLLLSNGFVKKPAKDEI